MIKVWRTISRNQMGLHFEEASDRRAIHATECVLLTENQALRIADDIYELLNTSFAARRRVDEEAAMHEKDVVSKHHKDREDHKHSSVKAMAGETNAEGRARAFVREQVGFMRRRATDLVAGLKSGELTVDQAEEIIEGDIAHEEAGMSEIAATIAHGVKA